MPTSGPEVLVMGKDLASLRMMRILDILFYF